MMRRWAQFPLQLLNQLLIAAATAYQWLVSPLLHWIAPGSGCRFYPSCSHYCVEALKTHGPLRGSWLALRRVCRCHPWGGHGIDLVPPKADSCACTQSANIHHPPLSRKNRRPANSQSPN